MKGKDQSNLGFPADNQAVHEVVDHAAKLLAHIYATTGAVWNIPRLKVGGDRVEVWLEMGKRRVRALVQPSHAERMDKEASLRLLAERISTERLKSRPDDLMAVSSNAMGGQRAKIAERARAAREKAHSDMVRLQQDFDRITEELAAIPAVFTAYYCLEGQEWHITSTNQKPEKPSSKPSRSGKPQKQSPGQTEPNTVGSIPPTLIQESSQEQENSETTPEPEPTTTSPEATGTETSE